MGQHLLSAVVVLFPSLSLQKLEALVAPYGNIVSTRILRDQASTSRGVGFVRYHLPLHAYTHTHTYAHTHTSIICYFAVGWIRKRIVIRL